MEDSIFKISLRIIGLLLMIIIVVMDDFPIYKKMTTKDTQLFLAIFVIICLYYDIILGFILALCLLLIYYEIYNKVKKQVITKKLIANKENFIIPENEINKQIVENKKKEMDADIIQLHYISDEHLLSAQNNIIDIDNYMVEIKGMEKGLNNEGVYGAQGLNSANLIMNGYDHNDKYLLL